MTRLTIAIGVVATELALAIALIAVLSLKALAHDAPSGWSYSFACCSSTDCRPVNQTTVKETATGYVVPSGEVVPYGSTKIKHSPDGEFHWCSKGGKNDTPTICLYVPPRSY